MPVSSPPAGPPAATAETASAAAPAGAVDAAALPRWRQRLGDWALALRHWPWLDTLRTLAQRFRQDQLALTAGSLTFTTLISLVPLMTVMLALFTAFPMFGRFQSALQKYFLQTLVPDAIARPVLQALTQFAGKASKLGGLGLALLLVTALALVITIDRTLNAIWRVPQQRPLAQRVLLYWSALTLGPLLLGGSLWFTSYVMSASRGLVDEIPDLLRLLLVLLQFAMLALGATLTLRFVPNTPVRWSHALAGGLFTAGGLELAKRGLAWYLDSVPTYSVIYGTFATLPILLLWIYLGWLIVLLGAVVAAYAPTLKLHVARLPDRPGAAFALALQLLKLLDGARGSAAGGLSTLALARATRIDPLQVGAVMERLHGLGWCGRLQEEGDPRWVLLSPPAQTLAAPLVDALLLHDTQASAAFRRQAGLGRLSLADLLAG